MKESQGYTLIELMIVVVIIGLLAAWAIPSYIRYTMRAALFDAKASAASLLIQAERYYTNHATYPTQTQLTGDEKPESSEEEHYKMILATCGELSLTQCVQVNLTPNPNKNTLSNRVTEEMGGETDQLWVRSNGENRPLLEKEGYKALKHLT